MRLSRAEADNLKTNTRRFDEEAELFLFGSRTDDEKKGGDIDILILSCKLGKAEVRKIRRAFCEQFGEQKIDIIIDNGELAEPFVQMIFKKAIRL